MLGVETKPRRTKAGKVLNVRRPTNGSAVGEVPISSSVDVLEAVERARSAQSGWVDLGPEERFRVLGGLVEVVGDSAEEIAEVIVAETGKPRVEALTEVLVSLDLLKYYREIAPQVLRRQWVKTGWWLAGKSSYTYREPYGVVGAITPWNYPFIIPMDAVAAGLFAGNAVVVKPSEHTPHSALKIAELCRRTEMPERLVEVVPGAGETGVALVRAGVDKILFTGSSRTGRKVMAAAAETLTPVALELGGKDPAIVLEDADLERAARGVVYGAFFNAGQTCLSTERAFVVRSVFNDFVEKVVKFTGELNVGNSGEYDVGPMVLPQQMEVVEDHVADAVSRGARVLVGGERLREDSNVYLPTVLVDVDPSMKVLWEETFGPVLPIVRVEDADEAVRMVNMSPYGLFASVWTEDRDRGEDLAQRLPGGGVSINSTLAHYAVPGLPVGGAGESGFGRRRGLAGLEELSRSRTIMIHRAGLPKEPWWFPYSDRAMRLVRTLLETRRASGMKRAWNVVRRLFGGKVVP